MIDAYLEGEDWDEPPPAMAFEASYRDIIAAIPLLVGLLSHPTGAEGAEALRILSAAAVDLYIRAPALVNVALNYKICAEHDLPFHPTVYYELAEARRYRMDHSLARIEGANRIYRASIDLARAALRLEPDIEARCIAFRSTLPHDILDFVYTGGADRYSWRASEPAKLRGLAAKVRAAELGAPVLVAAAHGAIMPSLLLAEYLGLALYFVRFSMFKRNDEAPILSMADEVWLSSWAEQGALLFDEDVAKGTTLELFARSLAPLFKRSVTACSIRHGGSSFTPDFVAHQWWD